MKDRISTGNPANPAQPPASEGAGTLDRTGSGYLPRWQYALVRRVLAALPTAQSVGHGIVAVSGGCDSTALLELLASARMLGATTPAFELTVVYVDHGQRVVAAREAALVAATAAAHDAAFVMVRPSPELDVGASEAVMRTARYRSLEEIADREGADWIATGHTRDDQTETVLMRLLRGGGRQGLSSIPGTRGRIVRPLLDISRSELERVLRERGVGWIEDASNRSLRHTRNRLRHVVLPTIEEQLGRGGLDHLPDLAARWRIEEDYLRRQAERFAAYATRRGAGGPEIDLGGLDRVPLALRGRVLRDWFAAVTGGVSLDIRQLAALERLAADRTGSATAAVAGVWLVREYERLRLAPAPTTAGAFAFAVDPTRTAVFDAPSGAWHVSVEPEPSAPARATRSLFRDQHDVAEEAIRGPLGLRPVAAGDVIAHLGRGMSKVSDIMVDLRVPKSARSDWPVLHDGDRIVWVPGIAVADDRAATGRGRRYVRFEWQRRR